MDKLVSYKGITFDDVLLEPRYSSIVPSEVDTATFLTKKIPLKIPIVSAAMDTVTEAELAIALALEGGIGIVHKNLDVADQINEVYKVKRSYNGVIRDPLTLSPDDTVEKAHEIIFNHNISGLPVIDKGKVVVGIITKRDMKFISDPLQRVTAIMTKDVVTAPEKTTLSDAKKILQSNKIEKLVLVDRKKRLKGMITNKDIEMISRYPRANQDRHGRLRVGAAVGVYDYERVERLVENDLDVVVVDTAHGHSRGVIETVRTIKKKFAIEVIAGNVATREGAQALIRAGADAVKVGIGPGSICTTRIIAGIGVPQISAIYSCARACAKSRIPVVADGGVKYSGDCTKALAAGASCVMIGSLFAGLVESPGEIIIYNGRQFKTYRGMGSMGAMVRGSKDRYGQKNIANEKLVPEGVEGRVPLKGKLSDFVYQLVGGVRAGMGYVGARTIPELRKQARFVEISAASLRESHPHDINITKESPNYMHHPVDEQ